VTSIGKYLTHYSNELEELHGYKLMEVNCVFKLEGHISNHAIQDICKWAKDIFSTNFSILLHHSTLKRTRIFLPSSLPLSRVTPPSSTMLIHSNFILTHHTSDHPWTLEHEKIKTNKVHHPNLPFHSHFRAY
jgi:hypothetical protein